MRRRTRKTGWRGWILLILLLGCDRDLSDDPIPIVTFPDFNVNIALPEYQALVLDGGYKELNNIGVRGVILFRKSAGNYLAFERNCSYHPNDACATVNVHSSKLYMEDPCCGSNFNFSDGAPSGGIAWRPLRQYRTEVVGSQITVTDDIVN